VSFLLRLAGAYVDAVLTTFYPLEQKPSMADLHAQQLADKEAEEDVAEPIWPEKLDRVDYLIAVVEDIRNTLSSAVSPDAAERPGEAVPPASPGHPVIYAGDLRDAARSAEKFAAEPENFNRDAWQTLSSNLRAAVESLSAETPLNITAG
jgi:hypothetical protein